MVKFYDRDKETSRETIVLHNIYFLFKRSKRHMTVSNRMTKPIILKNFIRCVQYYHMESQFKIDMQVDVKHHRYPYSIVWTALPCITCCFPCIGHTGICKSDGTIFDFVGRGRMHSGELAFGSPLKYLVLDHDQYSPEEWDDALVRANKKFEDTDHNIVTNNCHHHVAEMLNELNYKGRNNWGQVDIAFMVLKATHTSCLSYYVYVIFLALLLYLLL